MRVAQAAMDKFNARADATIGPHDEIANRAKKAIALLEEVMAAEIAPALVEVETDKSESGWPCWGFRPSPAGWR